MLPKIVLPHVSVEVHNFFMMLPDGFPVSIKQECLFFT